MSLLLHIKRTFRSIFLILLKEHNNKWPLLFAYLKLRSKFFFFYRLFGIKFQEESFLSLKVFFFEYSSFIDQFEGMFVDKQYYFASSKKNPVIIDGGANIGMATLYFKYLYPSAQITSFEADDVTAALLKKTIEVNKFKNVTLINKALSDKEKVADFYFEPKTPGSLIMSLEKKRYHKISKKIKTVTLSQFINKDIDLLKLDIEGSEGKVLQELIKKKRLSRVKQMIIEYHHHVDTKVDTMAGFLELLESNTFGYQVVSPLKPPFESYKFQDILIYCYRKR